MNTHRSGFTHVAVKCLYLGTLTVVRLAISYEYLQLWFYICVLLSSLSGVFHGSWVSSKP